MLVSLGARIMVPVITECLNLWKNLWSHRQTSETSWPRPQICPSLPLINLFCFPNLQWMYFTSGINTKPLWKGNVWNCTLRPSAAVVQGEAAIVERTMLRINTHQGVLRRFKNKGWDKNAGRTCSLDRMRGHSIAELNSKKRTVKADAFRCRSLLMKKLFFSLEIHFFSWMNKKMITQSNEKREWSHKLSEYILRHKCWRDHEESWQ